MQKNKRRIPVKRVFQGDRIKKKLTDIGLVFLDMDNKNLLDGFRTLERIDVVSINFWHKTTLEGKAKQEQF